MGKKREHALYAKSIAFSQIPATGHAVGRMLIGHGAGSRQAEQPRKWRAFRISDHKPETTGTPVNRIDECLGLWLLKKSFSSQTA
jgi:hypothetical protein